MGPVNNERQLAHVSSFVEDLPDHASVVTGGHRLTELSDGYFYAPTVLAGLEQHDRASQEEIFGPVITVQVFDGEDQAARWANGVESTKWARDDQR